VAGTILGGGGTQGLKASQSISRLSSSAKAGPRYKSWPNAGVVTGGAIVGGCGAIVGVGGTVIGGGGAVVEGNGAVVRVGIVGLRVDVAGLELEGVHLLKTACFKKETQTPNAGHPIYRLIDHNFSK
jgi:hypothetical protein